MTEAELNNSNDKEAEQQERLIDVQSQTGETFKSLLGGVVEAHDEDNVTVDSGDTDTTDVTDVTDNVAQPSKAEITIPVDPETEAENNWWAEMRAKPWRPYVRTEADDRQDAQMEKQTEIQGQLALDFMKWKAETLAKYTPRTRKPSHEGIKYFRQGLVELGFLGSGIEHEVLVFRNLGLNSKFACATRDEQKFVMFMGNKDVIIPPTRIGGAEAEVLRPMRMYATNGDEAKAMERILALRGLEILDLTPSSTNLPSSIKMICGDWSKWEHMAQMRATRQAEISVMGTEQTATVGAPGIARRLDNTVVEAEAENGYGYKD